MRKLAIAMMLGALACSDSGPGGPRVASVAITVPSTSLVVGQTLQLTAQARDASGQPLPTVAIAWSSSDTTIAAVTAEGLVTALAAGSVDITAKAGGRSGRTTLTITHVPVASVTVSPTSATIGTGGTLVLTATPRDSSGHVLAGRTIDWQSTNTAVVTVSPATGSRVIATGGAIGSGITITATSEGVTAGAQLDVVAAAAPTITGITPGVLTPGGSATITGANFSATPVSNFVTIDGVAATVTAAGAGQLTLTVPASGFTCDQARDVPVAVTVSGVTGSVLHALDVSTALSLSAGQSALFDSTAAQGACVSLPAALGARYLVAVTNVDAASGSRTFELDGAMAGASIVARRVAARRLVASAPPVRSPLDPTGALAAQERAHLALLERDRALVAARGGPRAIRARTAGVRLRRVGGAAALAATAAFAPAVGDTLGFGVRDVDHDVNCTIGSAVRARAVYVGPLVDVFEDIAAPLAGQADTTLQRIAREFESVTYPVLTTNFGNPLAYDAQLGNKGKVLVLFTPTVNGFAGGGLAGFVSACDFFPLDSSGAQANTVGNEAAIFYAFVPTSMTGTGTSALPVWQSFIRGVMPHETKHIVSYAEKFARGADQLEEPWLEESTAQTSSEIYQRAYSGQTWRGFGRWNTTVGCEPPLTQRNGCTGDHPQVMLHHFSFLYDYLTAGDFESPIGNSTAGYYGGAWSFVRWAIDQYAASESQMLQDITQTTHLFGVANLTARTGRPLGPMATRFALASALAADPAVSPADATLRLPSWDDAGIFAGMHDELLGFPRAYPLQPHGTAYGAFAYTGVLSGGGVSVFEIAGPQSAAQLLMLDDVGGVPLGAGSPMRLAIVRVQ